MDGSPLKTCDWIAAACPEVLVTVKVSVWSSPTTTWPKLSAAGFATSTGFAPVAVPVPDKPTVSAACPVIGIVITPETGPAAAGVNAAWNAQLAPAASDAPQVVVTLNPAG